MTTKNEVQETTQPEVGLELRPGRAHLIDFDKQSAAYDAAFSAKVNAAVDARLTELGWMSDRPAVKSGLDIENIEAAIDAAKEKLEDFRRNLRQL